MYTYQPTLAIVDTETDRIILYRSYHIWIRNTSGFYHAIHFDLRQMGKEGFLDQLHGAQQQQQQTSEEVVGYQSEVH